MSRKPKFSAVYPEAISEGADDLTLRAEEVKTLKACIHTDHVKENRWGPPLVDAHWHAFCQAIDKGMEGGKWEEQNFHNREMSKAAGAKKPSESQSQEQGEEFHAPVRKDDILGRKQTTLELWEEHLKDPVIALDKALKCFENPHQG